MNTSNSVSKYVINLNTKADVDVPKMILSKILFISGTHLAIAIIDLAGCML